MLGVFLIWKKPLALWLEGSLNDAFDNIAEENRDDKLSLLYEANSTNMVAVKTAVGMTKRVNMPHIVQQGGDLGPPPLFKYYRYHREKMQDKRPALLSLQKYNQNISSCIY